LKRSLIAIPAVLVALIAVLLIAPSFIDWSKYKEEARTQIKTTTGHDVALNGKLSLALLPAPSLYIENVVVPAPQGSARPNLAALERLDINIALLPLLTGKIEVSSVDLIKPEIALEVFKDGRKNWMTPELEAMSAKDPNAPQKEKPAISLRDIHIEEGNFYYLDKGKPMAVEKATVDIVADTLAQGPFAIKGTLVYAGQTVGLNVETGALEPNAESVSVKGAIALAEAGIETQFAGVVTTKEPFAVQGETEVSIASLSKTAKNYGVDISPEDDKAALKGLLTASADKIDFQNMALRIGGYDFTGDFAGSLKPLVIRSKFTSSDTMNLDQFIPKSTKKEEAQKDIGAILPETLTLPAMEADVAFVMPAAIYTGQIYKGVNASLVKKDKSFAVKFAATDIPGKGSIDMTADLNYAEKSVSQATGAETFSGPALDLMLKGNTQNMNQTVQAATGIADLPYVSKVKTATFNINGSAMASQLQLSQSTVKLDDTNFNVAGSYKKSGPRPRLVLDLSADTINLDKFYTAPAQTEAKGNPLDALKTLQLPYDVEFDVGVQNGTMQGKTVKGLRAQGALEQNAFKITNISVQDYAGAALAVKGTIGNLKELSGINLDVSGETQNIRKFAEEVKMDTSKLPANINAGKLAVKAAGDTKNMALDANISALGGSLIAKGNVNNPLSQAPGIDDLALQLKHSNMADAIAIFAPTAPRYTSLEKPMDFKADVKRTDKTYTLQNMSGNLAGATLTGNLTINTSDAKPAVNGTLRFGDLALQSARSKAVTSSSEGASPDAAKPRWSSEKINTAWMNSADIDLDIAAKSIVYETWDMKEPALKFTLSGGILKIEDLKAGLYGGTMAFNGTVNSTSGPLNVDGTANMDGVSVEQLVKSLVGNAIIKGQGEVSMDTKITTSGTSQAGLVNALAGSGTVTGKALVLEGFDLTRFAAALSEEEKIGDSVLGLWKGSIKGGSTAFDTLDGAFTITNGVANINKMDLNGPKAMLATKGNVNLPQWTITTAHTITLKEKPDVPPFTININGPLSNPGQTFAQGAINDYLKRKATRKIEKVLTDKLGDKIGIPGLFGGAPQPAVVSTPTPAPEAAVAPEAAPAQVAPSSGAESQVAPVAEPVPEAAPAEAAPATAEPAPEASPEEEAIKGLIEGLIQQ
jgi:uncharacterized protein involved in outer membrane biogenesis